MTKRDTESGSGFKPAISIGRIKGATEMVRKIGDALYLLDLTIEQWNDQLKRAQPHRNGRLIINFTRDSSTRLADKRVYNINPVSGKMIHMTSGSWRFFRLTDKDKYEKLSDLRVGKALPSDPLVVRLIDGIEDMLKQREFLCDTLNALSRGMPGKVASIMASCARRSDEAIDLADRVKLDWSEGAEQAEEKIRAKRRERYEKLKSSKAAKAKQA